jgi:hypothetical protein
MQADQREQTEEKDKFVNPFVEVVSSNLFIVRYFTRRQSATAVLNG